MTSERVVDDHPLALLPYGYKGTTYPERQLCCFVRFGALLYPFSRRIAAGGMEHLLEGEIATTDHCLAERRAERQAAVHHRGGMIEGKRLLPEL